MSSSSELHFLKECDNSYDRGMKSTTGIDLSCLVLPAFWSEQLKSACGLQIFSLCFSLGKGRRHLHYNPPVAVDWSSPNRQIYRMNSLTLSEMKAHAINWLPFFDSVNLGRLKCSVHRFWDTTEPKIFWVRILRPIFLLHIFLFPCIFDCIVLGLKLDLYHFGYLFSFWAIFGNFFCTIMGQFWARQGYCWHYFY